MDMDEEVTQATPEYMAARAERISRALAEGNEPPAMADEYVMTIELRDKLLATLAEAKEANIRGMEILEEKDKQIRYLVWQNEELKKQIAALKGGQS